MIQTLFNLLFNIRFNGVHNSGIFIDHFESQKNCASTTFVKCFLLHSKFVVRMYVPCKLRASIYHCSGSMFISQVILLTIYLRNLYYICI